MIQDRLGRPLRDLRISVTDRCNFRCRYCMPRDRFGEHHTFLPLRAQLSFEEIEMFVRACLPLGLTKARITGGEPLLRPGVPALVQRLSALGVEIALTTNASLLKEQAPLLAESGLDRVTVSLDALDPQTHASMVDSAIPVETVLEGIEAALENDLGPVKVNCVVQRGINESEVPALVRHFRGTGVIVRFIEYMDVGRTNGWSPGQVVPSNNLLRDLRKEFDLVPAEQASTSDVATMWTHSDGSGEVGFISSVSKPFCGECVRARLSADGHLFTCLFASGGHDLRAIIHGGGEIGDLTDAIAAVWSRRTDRYSEMRSLETSSLPRIEMSYIGG
ncbi:MAG: GTP 3',8-cyclase MoaA [Candidatus Thalassarchaeaceae archaeon]|nr:GTP 3',8-cyclase MoaA [Candidatus Thalassarchaeaceae archaeon]MDP6703156.1 GTP 3',8-cyclase MoaA [Candidatus Thalassarchaeaceae archaeon]MDP7003801.1 GTP 3',8-cyclase MoaA [Candidatus Thalassarchaeaceae archaeon]